jgi:aminoglycoside phosphotransferase (APT) family kinase protein
MKEDIIGIDVPAVTKWFEGHLPGTKPPLDFHLITGGHSNLTYKVSDRSANVYILRRPPIKQLSKYAHDVRREFRVMLALAKSRVPVPPVAGFCPDPAVTGAHFYVMKFVPGTPIHDRKAAEQHLDEQGRLNAAHQLIDAMVELHAIDPDLVGLGELGKKQGYIARQLKAWYKSYHSPVITEVRDALSARIPEQGPAALVHADLRLGNCLVDEKGRIQAVLDWETTTLGDPLADIALTLVAWSDPEAPRLPMELPSDAPGFPSRHELLERYREKSGRDLSCFDFHMAFQYWRWACITEDINERYKSGAYGEPQEVPELGETAEQTALHARDLLKAMG